MRMGGRCRLEFFRKFIWFGSATLPWLLVLIHVQNIFSGLQSRVNPENIFNFFRYFRELQSWDLRAGCHIFVCILLFWFSVLSLYGHIILVFCSVHLWPYYFWFAVVSIYGCINHRPLFLLLKTNILFEKDKYINQKWLRCLLKRSEEIKYQHLSWDRIEI